MSEGYPGVSPQPSREALVPRNEGYHSSTPPKEAYCGEEDGGLGAFTRDDLGRAALPAPAWSVLLHHLQ